MQTLRQSTIGIGANTQAVVDDQPKSNSLGTGRQFSQLNLPSSMVISD